MEQYTNRESNAEKDVQIKIDDASVELGENSTIDVLGGRATPDFYDLAASGFSENQLKDILRLRRQYNDGVVNELTTEYKRLQFARWLYKGGKLES